MWTSVNIFRYSWGKIRNSPLYILSRYLWASAAFAVAVYLCFFVYVLGFDVYLAELLFCFLLIFLLVRLWLHYFVLSFVKAETLRKKDFLEILKLYPSYLAAWILFFFAVCLGTVFFLVPGGYLYLRLQFFPQAIIEKKTGPVQSLKESWKATSNQIKELFILQLYSFGAVLLGALCFGIGVLVAFPLVAIGKAYLWRQLTESKGFFSWFR